MYTNSQKLNNSLLDENKVKTEFKKEIENLLEHNEIKTQTYETQ